MTRCITREEVNLRLSRTRDSMRRQGYSALLVYGNTRLHGSLRYLSDYYPDRSGWAALGPNRGDVHIFDGATLVVPLEGEPVLVMDFGLVMDQEPHVDRVPAGGLVVTGEAPSIATAIGNALLEANATARVGIETWDKFPAPIYLELRDAFPQTHFAPSTAVEELRLIKTPAEIVLIRKAAEVADFGNEAFLDALSNGLGKSELELIRSAEASMRLVDPIYEDACASGPSKIQSGSAFGEFLLHEPQARKLVRAGDVVNWDICMRYCGYAIDTSGTRVMGSATDKLRQAHNVQVLMTSEVIKAARPGTHTPALVEVAKQVAIEGGFELWAAFIGHGIGLDLHERPDMGLEDLVLAPGMTITVEPRIALDGVLIGTEDIVLITENEAECLTHFPKFPFELGV